MRADHPKPFFEVEGGSYANRRLLLVSHVFPPAQGVGALRWQKMASHVAERGWELDVITLHPECLDAPDWSRLADLPPGTRLFGVRTPVVPLARVIEAVWSRLRGIRPRRASRSDGAENPDAGAPATCRPSAIPRTAITWAPTDPRSYIRAYNAWFLYAELERSAREAAALGRSIVASGRHDAIISSGPPHAAHEAARRVSRSTGLPFAMDLRDPWSLFQQCPEGLASPILLRLGRSYERLAVTEAALVVTNTEAVGSAMAQEYPEARARIITVMNGFDEDPLPPTRHDSRFTVAYAGSIYLDRDPGCVFHAARQVIAELRLSPAQFSLEFIGANDQGVSLTALAEAEGIGPFIRVGESLPRAQALEFLSRASMLLVLPQEIDITIPAKVFEYMRFDAWLLALAEPHSATALVLRDSGADVVSPKDIGAIAAVIRDRYRQYAAGMRPRALASDPRLSRRSQSAILLDALERCVRPRQPDAAIASRRGLVQGAPT